MDGGRWEKTGFSQAPARDIPRPISEIPARDQIFASSFADGGAIGIASVDGRPGSTLADHGSWMREILWIVCLCAAGLRQRSLKSARQAAFRAGLRRRRSPAGGRLQRTIIDFHRAYLETMLVVRAPVSGPVPTLRAETASPGCRQRTKPGRPFGQGSLGSRIAPRRRARRRPIPDERIGGAPASFSGGGGRRGDGSPVVPRRRVVSRARASGRDSAPPHRRRPCRDCPGGRRARPGGGCPSRRPAAPAGRCR
ncbi:hypothetical protein LKMONMHP_2025 [Methylobacterium organophilum]|uniref:Uncharacterized protein n=1 Tax=Methylobacterium organophilum TaxID=410 RepID=A0ABQ4T6C2_METOR|nr:hypothetical protein LKMONMHP_2025 [Methylobacterium organophilum]